MRKYIFLMTFLAFLPSCSCSEEGKGPVTPGGKPKEPETPVEEVLPQIEVSRIAKTAEGKVYLEVDGKPFPLFGAQIRVDVFKNCDKLTDAQIEPYFQKAAQLNLNCVQVPITWKGMEPSEGKYDFAWMDMILEYAVKYGLKVELLWFSTNMIGDSYTWFVPGYPLKNLDTRLLRKGTLEYDYLHNLYGYTYNAVFNHPDILKAETAAVTALFNHIRNWDAAHGETHPVITCQLHNEIDGLVRWRITDEKLNICKRDGTKLTEAEAWEMSLDAVDAVGKAVKNSPYKVVTRVNYTSCTSPGVFPQCTQAKGSDAFYREGVDIVSVDPYMSDVNSIASVVKAFTELKGNYPLIAENRGGYDTTPSLILTAAALGAGYDIYDLATSKFIHDNNGVPWGEEGVLNYDLMDRPYTPKVRSILKGLTEAAEDVALTSKENFVAFNVNKDYPDDSRTLIVNTTGASLTINSSNGALGFVLDRGDNIVMYFTAPATVVIENGSVEGGKKTFSLEGEKLTRVGFTSSKPLTSTTASCIGSN